MEPFFSEIPKYGLGQTIWMNNCWGIWGIFAQFISTHFGTVSPLSMFFFNQSLFLQNTEPLYPNSNIHLGSVFEFKFEFGLHRIRDLAIVCP